MDKGVFEMMGNVPNNNNSMLQHFLDFRKNLLGDPKQQVMELLRTGKMSNEQFQQLQSKASEFQKMFGIK